MLGLCERRYESIICRTITINNNANNNKSI